MVSAAAQRLDRRDRPVELVEPADHQADRRHRLGAGSPKIAVLVEMLEAARTAA